MGTSIKDKQSAALMANSPPVPPHKPPVPETGTTANSMNRLLNNTADILRQTGQTVSASRLGPYGTGHDLSALGHNKPYPTTGQTTIEPDN